MVWTLFCGTVAASALATVSEMVLIEVSKVI